MKGQEHNKGELKELKVSIEKWVVEEIQLMSKNTKFSVEELVVIALKRFIDSHADYRGTAPKPI
jgi:hypothetical protein